MTEQRLSPRGGSPTVSEGVGYFGRVGLLPLCDPSTHRSASTQANLQRAAEGIAAFLDTRYLAALRPSETNQLTSHGSGTTSTARLVNPLKLTSRQRREIHRAGRLLPAVR